MTKTVPILWVSSVLKRYDAGLNKICSNITNENKIEVRNAPIFCSLELLLTDLILKVTERLSLTLRHEAICFLQEESSSAICIMTEVVAVLFQIRNAHEKVLKASIFFEAFSKEWSFCQSFFLDSP